MKTLVLTFYFVCLRVATSAASPVSKVLQLLGQLETKITKEGDVEAKMFKEYMEWCDDGHKDTGYAIKTAKSKVEDLTADISKALSDIDSGKTKIEELAASIGQDQADLKAASEIRAKESAEFKATEEELVEAVDMLDRAVNVLERKFKGSALMQTKYGTKDIKSMLSALNVVVDAAGLSLHDKQRLTSLAQSQTASDDEDDDTGAPAPDAYKGHSGSIIEVLEDMREKAHTQLGEARKEESNAKHNFAMLKQSLEDQIAADSKELDETKSNKAAAQEAKAVATGDLDVTKKGLAEDEESLANLDSDCATKKEDYDASTKGRAEELKALAAAKKVLSEMTGAAEGITYSAASFLQVFGQSDRLAVHSGLSTRSDLVNLEVVNAVRQIAKKEKDAALMQLAGRIAAEVRYSKTTNEDPFVKVKAMISDMIAKLESTAKSEANHKEYCDKELGESKAKMEELQATIGKLSAKKDKDMAASVKLKGEVKELQAELAIITKSQAEADKIRSGEHKAFVTTKADLEQGIEGVRAALKVLREYYASGEAALVQKPESPGTHSKASGAGSSIIGMLEVVASDFAKGLAAAEVEEDSAAVEYEKISQTNRVTKGMKEKDVVYKTKEAAALDKSTAEVASDAESATSELDAIMEYKKGLIGACVVKPETYEGRKARREAEITGLQDALKILEGQAVLLQKPSGLRGASVAPHRK